MLVLGLVEVPWWALLVTALVIFLSYTARDFNYFRKQGIPGPTPIPIFGTSYFIFLKGMVEREMNLLRDYGNKKCHGLFIGSLPIVSVYDEEMLSEIMVKEFSTFTNRLVFGNSNGTILGSMLVNLADNHWKHARSEMTPTFTSGKLKKMNAEVNRCAQSMADALTEKAKLGEIVEFKEYAGGFTMDVIASTAFGIKVESQKDRNNPFVLHAKEAFDFNFRNPLNLIRLFFPSFSAILNKLGYPLELIPVKTQEFFYDITKRTMEIRRAEVDQSRSDFLQLMVNAQRGENIKDNEEDSEKTVQGTGRGLTNDAILANAMLFFVAGYDTTSNSLSFFMYNMALNPECQDKLSEEITRVIGEKDFVDYNLLQEMPYLEQCINENLRLYPPATRVNRAANRDITIKDVFIRKGLAVNIPIYAIHHDPRKWPDPEKFDPDRFSPENKKERSPYHFLPFGNGPRNCIGMRLALQELKVSIIHVLKRVRVSTCDKTQIPIVFARSTLLKPKDGIWLKLEPRNAK